MQSATPNVFLHSVWPMPLSLATTRGISVDFFSSPYLDVSVQAVPSVRLWIHRTVTEYCSAGLLHSDIHGSKPACGSPWLFAACHVLRRFLMPRHSPCALSSLTWQLAERVALSGFPVALSRSCRLRGIGKPHGFLLPWLLQYKSFDLGPYMILIMNS